MPNEIYKLYKDEVTLTFNPEKHLYTVTDVQNPDDSEEKAYGTTSILQRLAKPALIYWAANQGAEFLEGTMQPGKSYDELEIKELANGVKMAHRRKKDESADVGHLAHKWIEDWIAGRNPKSPVNKKVKNATDSFLQWVKDRKVEFVLSEQKIYSRKYNYAGTLDFTARIDGRDYIGDIKTSNAFYPEMMFQVSAYKEAREEEHPEEHYEGRIIVRCGKDGSFEEIELTDTQEHEKDFSAFLGTLLAHDRLEKIKDIEMSKKRELITA